MLDQPQKLDLKSMDITEEKKRRFKQLFPEVFREDEIDFDHLKRVLSKEWDVDGVGKERFGLQWPGKAECMKIIQQPSVATLKPDREESVNFEDTENLFIEGDNLEVLKLLQKSYFGKVKMMYIDPPYNTGNEFIYPDNYSESLDTYLKYTGQKDEEGNWQTTNRDTDGRFHSRWLNMMYPRLFLAKNLLQEDGVIFISIDDNEVANLTKLCEEIFGEENHLGTILWKKKTNGNNVGHIPPVHDYILVFAKLASESSLEGFRVREEYIEKKYSNPDNDSRGPWTTQDLSANHKGPYFEIENPKNGETYFPPEGRYWVFNNVEVKKRIDDGRIIFGKTGNSKPVQKVFLQERETRWKPESWWDNHGMNQDGTDELGELFVPKIFDHPKPSKLLKNLVEIGCDNNGIVLDFFAGTCPLAHSIFIENVSYSTDKKFICIQLPEKTSEDSIARGNGFQTIAELGKERIRRVIKKIEEGTKTIEKKETKQSTLGLDIDEDSVSWAKLETGKVEYQKHKNEAESEESLDLGFKVFKLEPSNFKVWDAPEIDVNPDELEEQLDVFADHITPEAQRESILYELILKSGYPLTTPVKQKEIDGKTIFSIQDDALLIYLDEGLTFEMLEQMAKMEPERMVCLDQSFTGEEADALKTNAVQLFKSHDIAFRTV